MKITSHIARILLGLIFTVFGLNGFLHFIPLPLPSGVPGQFMGALFVSHYYVAAFAVQAAGGILFLIGSGIFGIALARLGAFENKVAISNTCGPKTSEKREAFCGIKC